MSFVPPCKGYMQGGPVNMFDFGVMFGMFQSMMQQQSQQNLGFGTATTTFPLSSTFPVPPGTACTVDTLVDSVSATTFGTQYLSMTPAYPFNTTGAEALGIPVTSGGLDGFNGFDTTMFGELTDSVAIGPVAPAEDATDDKTADRKDYMGVKDGASFVSVQGKDLEDRDRGKT